MSRFKIRERRVCAMCNRVGTRVFMRTDDGRTVCRNQRACVERLCDKLFLDKPKWTPAVGDMVYLGTLMPDVKLYGVVNDPNTPGSMTATLVSDDATQAVKVLQEEFSITIPLGDAP